MSPLPSDVISVDTVFVRGLEFRGNHGYYEEERKTSRRFRASVELRSNLKKASESDALADTIDYFRVCQTIVEIGEQKTFKLLERLAGRIALELQTLYPTCGVTVEIEKLAPPCPGVPYSCGVIVRREALETT